MALRCAWTCRSFIFLDSTNSTNAGEKGLGLGLRWEQQHRWRRDATWRTPPIVACCPSRCVFFFFSYFVFSSSVSFSVSYLVLFFLSIKAVKGASLSAIFSEFKLGLHIHSTHTVPSSFFTSNTPCKSVQLEWSTDTKSMFGCLNDFAVSFYFFLFHLQTSACLCTSADKVTSSCQILNWTSNCKRCSQATWKTWM